MMAKTFGNWETLGVRIAEGGQGEIYEVRNLTGEPAGKWLLKRLKNPKRQSRFEREIVALERLRGAANVIQIEDRGALDTPNVYYYVMERGDGSLEDLAPPEGYLVPKALEIFGQILGGVEAIHQVEVVHRDLKPPNIILFGLIAKVADTGLALLVDEVRVTPTDEAVGPRFYMAPELEHGRNLAVDARADLYSLGKILYWLLSGGVNLPRERHSEPQYCLAKTKAPSLAVFSNVFAATLKQEARARSKNVVELRELFLKAAEEYRAHPDTALEALLSGSGSLIVDSLSAEDISVSKAFFKRIRLGLATATGDDLLALAEVHSGLIDRELLKLIEDIGPLSAGQIRRAAHLYFRDKQTVYTLTYQIGARSTARMAIANYAVEKGNTHIREHMAKFWYWDRGDVELAHLLAATFSAETKLPKDLILGLSTSGISAEMTDLILRGIREYPGDSELARVAFFALAKSTAQNTENIILESFNIVADQPDSLKNAVLTTLIFEVEAAAWSIFLDTHQCPDELVNLANMMIDLRERAGSTSETEDNEDPADP